MADSMEVCTDYLTKWLLNDDEELLATAQDHARCCLDELERFVVGVLDSAEPDSVAWYTRRELTDFELANRIDWADVAETILCE